MTITVPINVYVGVVADEKAVENLIQKGTTFNKIFRIIDFITYGNTVDNISDDLNERKKEVNDGLCGKSAPCCRGPRPRLSRTRHRLVID